MADGAAADLGGPRMAASVKEVFDDSAPRKGGRPRWLLIVMINYMMLQRGFNFTAANAHDSQCMD